MPHHEHGTQHSGPDSAKEQHDAPQKTLQPGPALVKATRLNLRSAPALHADNIVGVVEHGTSVQVLAGTSRNGFHEVVAPVHGKVWASAHHLDHGAVASGHAAVQRILGTTTPTAPAPAPVAPPKCSITLLVGSGYSHAGETKPYGHCALRVVDGAQDTTYDYGRYGKTWGVGSSEGEGMLRVWSSFDAYIAGENATTRTTTAYTFDTTPAGAQLLETFFKQKIAGHPPVQVRSGMTQYRILDDYDALTSNCTTLSLHAAQLVMAHLDDNHDKFGDMRGLSGFEKGAAMAKGRPDGTFMPGDLKAELDDLHGAGAPRVQTYKAQ